VNERGRQRRCRFGTPIASVLGMVDEDDKGDETYVALLLWTICVLTFACGVMAITQHPDWFGA
jgi:hypothetical protein